ncbi:hypothetical protein KZP23_20215 [Echinicola marina]|uniref:hypothetical protein n=1 Tax=Echinicola marina TaxID=2859768 RepID=UPI001CF6A4ED|nr:hypothetical protein [Echinicola marina]UCS92962.1 hypothetical protein KZP23_20215 [Echinicola marina]
MNPHPNIVEIIGVPGVGKSSVFKELCNEWNSKQKWTHLDALINQGKTKSNGFINQSINLIKRFLKVKKHQSFEINKGIQYAHNNEVLSQFFWQHLSNTEFEANADPALRFRSAFFLYRDFCRYQAIHDNANGIPCIMDEGFLQKSFLVHKDKKIIEAVLDDYLSLIQLPKAVIWVHVRPIHIILDRIKMRKKRIASHIDLGDEMLKIETKKWMRLIKLLIKKVEQKGVRIYKIDGRDSIENNVKKVKSILSSLS